ncbi:MAG: UDP-glucose 4-epimerase GalE [Luteimonas sp.]
MSRDDATATAPEIPARGADRLILVTGGTGYIGAHTCVCLQQAGYRVLIIDDLSNSEATVVDAITALTRHRPLFERGDIRDAPWLEALVTRHRPTAAIHFAGVKSVAASTRDPVTYFDINVGGSIRLLQALARHGRPRLVFSSSATVYGEPDHLPLREDHPLRPESAYGRSKMMVELILTDLCASAPGASAIALRYFNPVGAHAAGTLGDAPRGEPENLMPHLGRVASGATAALQVFGNDYATPDGTCVRDYVHVMDLAEAHVAALARVLREDGYRAINIGTGIGTSVLELVDAYARASGRAIPFTIADRRAGDVGCYYADPRLAHETLHWHATRDLRQMCEDAYRHVGVASR